MPKYNESTVLGYDLDIELPFVEHEGERYLLGSAGSLILFCSICGEEHFRDVGNYWLHSYCHKCFVHTDIIMQPMKLSEIVQWNNHFGRGAIPVEARRTERLRKESLRPWDHQFGNTKESDYPDGIFRKVELEIP